MGYLFLSIALISGIVKAYCGKKTSNYTADIEDAVSVNFIRMLLCVIIGFCLIIFKGEFEFLRLDFASVIITAFSGISTAVFVITWLLAVKKGAYMMVEVFVMMGVTVPLVLSNIFFSEDIRLVQWFGLIVLIIATLIMCSYNSSQKQKLRASSLLILTICGISSGLADFSQKLFVLTKAEAPISVFNFYTYIFSALFIIPILIFYSIKREIHFQKQNNRQNYNIFGYVLVMAVCLFSNSYFKTKAAVYLESSELYPLSQGGSLVLASVMSAVCFKEKITIKSAIGSGLAFVGLIIINVL